MLPANKATDSQAGPRYTGGCHPHGDKGDAELGQEQSVRPGGRGRKGLGGKRGWVRPLILFSVLIFKDNTFMIWFLAAFLRKKGETIIEVLGLQILEVRVKEIQPYTRWCRHLLYNGTCGPAARPGSPHSRPPTSQPAFQQDPWVILRHLQLWAVLV